MSDSKKKPYWLLVLAAVILICILLVIFGINGGKEEPRKVGLILTGESADEGWNGAHYQGVKSACEQLGVEFAGVNLCCRRHCFAFDMVYFPGHTLLRRANKRADHQQQAKRYFFRHRFSLFLKNLQIYKLLSVGLK